MSLKLKPNLFILLYFDFVLCLSKLWTSCTCFDDFFKAATAMQCTVQTSDKSNLGRRCKGFFPPERYISERWRVGLTPCAVLGLCACDAKENLPSTTRVEQQYDVGSRGRLLLSARIISTYLPTYLEVVWIIEIPILVDFPLLRLLLQQLLCNDDEL